MAHHLRSLAPTVLLCLTAAPLAAQSTSRLPSRAEIRRAAESITEADVRQRIGVIADDSMRGRPTPSPELEETAAYVADAFRSFGLRPGGDSGTYFQRYPIRRVQLDSSSFVMMMGRGVIGRWAFGRDVAVASLPNADSTVTGPVVLVVGLPADTAHPFGDVDLRGAVVVQALTVARVRGDGPLVGLLEKGIAAGARAWILLVNAPAPFIAARSRSQLAPQYLLGDAPPFLPVPVLMIQDSSATDVLRAAGEDIVALRDSSAHGVRAMSGFTVTVNVVRRQLGEASAPNVIGVLDGSDPRLADEYVFFTGHMDHIGVAGGGQGCGAVGADSICNGADDDASGTIAVVELAQAFASLNPRPRRSVVFMTVSGEERGLWGSRWYAEHPGFPLERTVADLNTDMIGRYYQDRPGWRDTIVVIGKEHSSLGAVADRVTRAHPELRMHLIDDIWPEENFYRRSDHFNFARKGVPILFFFNGTHPDYHGVGDSADRIDAEKAARIVRMVFYIGLEVANATARPLWDPERRREIVEEGR